MGTRNLTIVKMNGEVKVAQYGQWDGYPTGQGYTIADFIQDKMDLRKLKSKLKKINFIDEDAIHEKWKSVGADDSGFVNMKISDDFLRKYPYLHRDVGAQVLEIIQDGVYTHSKLDPKTYKQKEEKITGIEVDGLHNDIEFMKDGLFCEFAYEIDLDKKVVKVYTGGRRPKRIIKFKDFTRETMKKLEEELSAE